MKGTFDFKRGCDSWVENHCFREEIHGGGLNSTHTEFIELEPSSVTLFEIWTLPGS